MNVFVLKVYTELHCKFFGNYVFIINKIRCVGFFFLWGKGGKTNLEIRILPVPQQKITKYFTSFGIGLFFYLQLGKTNMKLQHVNHIMVASATAKNAQWHLITATLRSLHYESTWEAITHFGRFLLLNFSLWA